MGAEAIWNSGVEDRKWVASTLQSRREQFGKKKISPAHLCHSHFTKLKSSAGQLLHGATAMTVCFLLHGPSFEAASNERHRVWKFLLEKEILALKGTQIPDEKVFGNRLFFPYEDVRAFQLVIADSHGNSLWSPNKVERPKHLPCENFKKRR